MAHVKLVRLTLQQSYDLVEVPFFTMFIFFTRALLIEEVNLIDDLKNMFVKHEILKKKYFWRLHLVYA